MKYYIFNSKTNSFLSFDELESLLQFIAKYNRIYNNKTYNLFFEDLKLNSNDMKACYNYNTQKNDYYPRELMVLDENNRIIDVRLYKDLIFYYNFHRVKKKVDLPIFRKDPIPNLCPYKYKKYRKKPKLINEFKQSSDKDIIKYVRQARNFSNLIVFELYDFNKRDIVKNDKSWKLKKIKKQWMKNLK